jgi:hypothetical protein
LDSWDKTFRAGQHGQDSSRNREDRTRQPQQDSSDRKNRDRITGKEEEGQDTTARAGQREKNRAARREELA